MDEYNHSLGKKQTCFRSLIERPSHGLLVAHSSIYTYRDGSWFNPRKTPSPITVTGKSSHQIPLETSRLLHEGTGSKKYPHFISGRMLSFRVPRVGRFLAVSAWSCKNQKLGLWETRNLKMKVRLAPSRWTKNPRTYFQSWCPRSISHPPPHLLNCFVCPIGFLLPLLSEGRMVTPRPTWQRKHKIALLAVSTVSQRASICGAHALADTRLAVTGLRDEFRG